MNPQLVLALRVVGVLQLSILVASALVPVRLNWKTQLAELPALVRQLFWVYGGYVVLSIISLGLIALFNAEELASGSGLARSVCLYGAVFWGVRLSLQPVLQAKPFLTTWWLRAGYHLLTALFISCTVIWTWGVIHGG